MLFTVFDIWQADDYCLEVGVKGQADVSIDDITIRHENLGKRKITQRQPLVKAQAKLVFSEDFNGTKINQKRWNISGDQERRGGLWLKQCAYLDGKGHLVLEFKKDKKSGKFAMGAVNTAGKFTVKYGYIEARMKVGREVGHWPGVWLTAKSTNQVGNMGRDGTEIDIVELPWRHKDEVSHALHWDGYNEDHSSVGNHVKVPGINQGWHTYAVDWSPDGYIFFVDGKETWRTDAGGVCRVPLHLLLSDEMGGWSGNPNNAKKLPDFTYVDYIKVWQQ
jgi:beta-glucanase (GH16 family)